MATKFNLENTLGYLINRCSILLKSELTHRLNQAGYDVTPEEWVILNRLWEQGGLSQNELAEQTIKDKTTITRFLHQMEAKGLITRKSSKEDGRFKKVQLTANGKKLKSSLIPIAQEMLAHASADLSKNELQIVLGLLKKIEHNLLDLESSNR
jgi:MarR family transcriptional regulator, organic hydroperoxide resistance regulator